MSLRLQGIRVLVIEDHEDSRAGYELLFGHEGARVQGAASAEEALAAIPAFQPHVLLSDLGLPEMDGLAFIRRLRSWPADRGGHCPAIALSGSPEARASALAVGYQAYVIKPADPLQLVGLIRELANPDEVTS